MEPNTGTQPEAENVDATMFDAPVMWVSVVSEVMER